MTMPVPLITVAVPAYNSAAYIDHTLASVMAQDIGDYELIVCDDGSVDATPEICARYVNCGLRYVPFRERGGQAENWNRCIAEARGKYLVILHDDDLLRPSYLRRATDMLSTRPDVGLVHCAIEHIADGGAPLTFQRLFDEDRVTRGDDFFRRLIVEGCLINPAGVMVRRTLYEKVGGFTTDVLWGIDWHMWLRICRHASVGYLAEALAMYRQRASSGTVAVAKTARNGGDEAWVVDDIFRRVADRRDLLSLRPYALRQVAHRTWCHAETMCREGHMPAARAGLARAVRIWPRMVLQRRVVALWLATWFGYDWFTGLRERLHHRGASA